MSNKNTKKTIVMAAAAAAVTGGAMAVTGNAHADTVSSSANTQTQDSQASDLKSQQDTSRQNYADAKQDYTRAQEDLAQVTAKNTEAQGNVDNAQTDVNNASDNVQSAATAERSAQTAVDHAQSEANNAQSDYDQAVSQAAQDNQAAKDAQDVLNKANQAVSDAQKTADEASQKQAQAQSNADTAAQNVDATNDQVQKRQSDVDKAQDSVKTAQDDVKNAQSHDQLVSQDTQDVTAKTSAKNAADAKVNDAQKISDEKKGAKSSAEQAVKNAQSVVDGLSKDIDQSPLPTFKFTDQQKQLTQSLVQEYMAYLKEGHSIATSNDVMNLPSFKAWQSAMTYSGGWHMDHDDLGEFLGVSWTDENAQDKATVIDLNHMSTDNVQELSQWTAAVLNQITAELGIQKYVGKIVVTSGMVGMAQEVAALTSENNQSGYGHYLYGLNKAAYDYGLTDDTQYVTDEYKNSCSGSNKFGESADSMASSDYSTKITMAGAKESILVTIKNMLANDSSSFNQHTTALLGITNLMNNDPQVPGQVLGVSISANAKPDGRTTTHIIEFSQSQVMSNGNEYKNNTDAMKKRLHDKGTNVILNNPYEGDAQEDHATQLANAKQVLQEAQAKLNTATTEATQADADLASAQAAAQTAATELKAAQTKLAHDQESGMSLAGAQAELTKAQSVLAQKQANLADAKTAAQKAQDMQTQADAALASVKADSQKAQTELANAQAKAKSAQVRVDELTGADQAVTAAQEKLNAANEALRVAQSNHNQAQANLTKAQAALTKAETALKAAQDTAAQTAQELTAAQAKAGSAKAALDKAKASLITDAKVYGDSVAIKDITIHAGEAVPTPEIANPMADDPTQDLVMGAYLKLAASKLDTIPTGTTVAWANLAQLNADAQIVGNHQEGALITFPDGSTMTLGVPLTVLAAQTPAMPVDPSKPSKPTEPTNPSKPADPTDGKRDASQTDRNKSTDDQGQTTTDGRTDSEQSAISNDTRVNGDSNVTVKTVATANTTNGQPTNKRSDLNNGQLPQTSNKNENALIGLGLVTMLGMFGLAGIRCKN